MKILFAGRDNSFNRKIVDELSAEHEVVACFFLEPNRRKFSNRYKRILARIKRYGIIRVMDELLFHVFDRTYIRKPEQKLFLTKPDYYITSMPLKCPTYEVENIHDSRWLDLIRTLAPDIIFSMCCNVIFKPELYTIPPLGTFVLHEGITPEYKGLHTNLWALLKREHAYIGFSLIQVNNNLDGGPLLAQGGYSLKPEENYRMWSWISHNALIEALGDIKEALRNLDNNKGFTPLETGTRKSGTYTWMTFSQVIRLLFASRNAGKIN